MFAYRPVPLRQWRLAQQVPAPPAAIAPAKTQSQMTDAANIAFRVGFGGIGVIAAGMAYGYYAAGARARKGGWIGTVMGLGATGIALASFALAIVPFRKPDLSV